MRRLTVAVLSVASVLLIACGAPDRGDDGGDDGGDDDPINGDNCSDASRLVYVVDTDNTLSTFDPATKTFNDLGTLNCPAMTTVDPIFGIPVQATPFSMGIDRNANAWVLYNSSELMQVTTSGTLGCTKANFNPPAGLSLFGMGFSTDAAGGSADTLYIAGSDDIGTGNATLAKLDITTMQTTNLGVVQGNPELTGTGSAELWGFFPDAAGTRISRLNKQSGMVEQSFPLNTLTGQPAAWAFAFWGGDFWVFLQRDTDLSTSVYQVSGTTGMLIGTTPTSGRNIVGAGVSTCAPTVIL